MIINGIETECEISDQYMSEELITKSKRPGMNCSIDVFFEETEGFSAHINDRNTYKTVLVKSGSCVIEENDGNRVITAPAGIFLNEKADFKVISENRVVTRTLFFKPTFIREEFTFEAINSGKYDKFFTAVKDADKKTASEKLSDAREGECAFEECFSDSIYQDYLLLTEFFGRGRDIVCYSITKQEYDMVNRLAMSARYDLVEQPDNLWILRVRYFIMSLLFIPTADFYINWRQYELYKDSLVAKVSSYFWDHLNEEITLESVLKRFSVNKNTLNDAFNNEVSMSCMAYLEDLRVNRAKKMLQFGDETVSEISQICGYDDTSYFSKVFKKHTGQTPSEYRRQMKAMC